MPAFMDPCCSHPRAHKGLHSEDCPSLATTKIERLAEAVREMGTRQAVMLTPDEIRVVVRALGEMSANNGHGNYTDGETAGRITARIQGGYNP